MSHVSHMSCMPHMPPPCPTTVPPTCSQLQLSQASPRDTPPHRHHYHSHRSTLSRMSRMSHPPAASSSCPKPHPGTHHHCRCAGRTGPAQPAGTQKIKVNTHDRKVSAASVYVLLLCHSAASTPALGQPAGLHMSSLCQFGRSQRSTTHNQIDCVL